MLLGRGLYATAEVPMLMTTRLTARMAMIGAAAVLVGILAVATPVLGAQTADQEGTQPSSTESNLDYPPPIEQQGPLVYGGSDVINPGWIVALFRNGAFICTASLVDTEVVLTAAHCVDEPGSYSVLIDEEYLYAAGITRSVTSIHIHPGWGGNFNDTDLALLGLDSPVVGVELATLNTTGLWPEWAQALTVAGWGQYFEGSPAAPFLQAAGVFATSGMDATVDRFYCDLPVSAMTVGGMFCFGGPVTAGACPGDSGGPVVGWASPSASSGTLVIYGAVSYGPVGCGPSVWDAVAQSVGGHDAWIQSVITDIKAPPPIAQNDGPFAVPWAGSVSPTAPGVLGNDLDPAGSGLVAVKVSEPTHGTVVLQLDGSFTYTHNGDSATSDSFTYRAESASDSSKLSLATVTMTIANRPPPPVDHKTGLVDPASGKWHLYDDAGVMTTSFFYGNPGDYPFMGDWNCNKTETPGLYRQSDGYAYLRNSNTQGNAEIKFFFGDPGDVPIAGDFNGDGCDTLSIYRPSNQTFYIINKLGENDGGLGAAEFSYVFGDPGDKPFVGDFDGDGIETVGLHRESTGLVYFRNSHTQGNADAQFVFGDPGDRLIAGDWNDDGKFSPALYRPSNMTMYFRYTNTQGNADAQFVPNPNGAGWLPVSGTR
jgi:hypothetical protein